MNWCFTGCQTSGMNYVESPLSLAVFASLSSSGMPQNSFPTAHRKGTWVISNTLHGYRRVYLPVTNKNIHGIIYLSSCTRGGKQCVPFSENAFLHQLQNHKEISGFKHYSLTRQNGVKINRKLKSYPPLLLGQLLKYFCHLTCNFKHQWSACSSKSSWFWTTWQVI